MNGRRRQKQNERGQRTQLHRKKTGGSLPRSRWRRRQAASSLVCLRPQRRPHQPRGIRCQSFPQQAGEGSTTVLYRRCNMSGWRPTEMVAVASVALSVCCESRSTISCHPCNVGPFRSRLLSSWPPGVQVTKLATKLSMLQSSEGRTRCCRVHGWELHQ